MPNFLFIKMMDVAQPEGIPRDEWQMKRMECIHSKLKGLGIPWRSPRETLRTQLVSAEQNSNPKCDDAHSDIKAWKDGWQRQRSANVLKDRAPYRFLDIDSSNMHCLRFISNDVMMTTVLSVKSQIPFSRCSSLKVWRQSLLLARFKFTFICQLASILEWVCDSFQNTYWILMICDTYNIVSVMSPEEMEP